MVEQSEADLDEFADILAARFHGVHLALRHLQVLDDDVELRGLHEHTVPLLGLPATPKTPCRVLWGRILSDETQNSWTCVLLLLDTYASEVVLLDDA